MNKIERKALVDGAETIESDIDLINQFALKELKAEDVFTFKLGLCDNEVDRDVECFPISTLEGLAKMFVGKTIIKDHCWSSDNQVARIYKTELQPSGDTATTGEPYTQLVGYCYILRSAQNESLIADIEGGIKSECSVSFSVKAAVCSICGEPMVCSFFGDSGECGHTRGETYDEMLCYRKLLDAVDAYEVSLVAVPAQPASGVKKEFDDTDEAQTDTAEEAAAEPQAEQTEAVEEDTTETEKMFIELSQLYINNEKKK